jgi:hypothetical protein
MSPDLDPHLVKQRVRRDTSGGLNLALFLLVVDRVTWIAKVTIVELVVGSLKRD